MRLRMVSVATVIFLLSFLFPSNALAKIGVGVGTGKIYVDEVLNPGGLYTLPDIVVINTGDEESTYRLSVTYHEDQEEMQPLQEWFVFEPSEFNLAPGENRSVSVKLNLPTKVIPGEYFAFLEASPDSKLDNGSTKIGIAAASKLYFEVAPANLLQAIYYRIVSLWREYQPWTNIVAGVTITVLVTNLLRRFIHIDVSMRKNSKINNKQEKHQEVEE